MAAHLTVTKSTGQQLFDTNLINYGLVKSGNLAYIESWSARLLKSIQLDPNDGSNWSESVTTSDPNQATPMYGFTLANCLSPIVFIVGTGTSSGSKLTGSTITFMYANADANTKFYCFDLVANNILGSPFLKTYLSTGQITFNSLQNPCNVVASIQAPAIPDAAPGSTDTGIRANPYVGGYVVRRSLSGDTAHKFYTARDARVDIALNSGIEYAAFLPWSRLCGNNDYDGTYVWGYGASEGAYGRVGGISFMFGMSGATNLTFVGGSTSSSNFYQIPTIYPTALVIATTNLPFPYN